MRQSRQIKPMPPRPDPMPPLPQTERSGRSPRVPKGRLADRIGAFIAAGALVLSIGIALWFWAGFYETDPGFKPASSAALLVLGLGAFAIIPAAVVMRLCWSAWQGGFRPYHGLWTLFLMGPWIILGLLILIFAPIPFLFGLGALLFAAILCGWALASLILARHSVAQHNPEPDIGFRHFTDDE